MPDFYTDPQGRVRPIRGKGKGAVVAGALALGRFVAGGQAASLGGGAAAGEGRCRPGGRLVVGAIASPYERRPQGRAQR
jgi:hypothetical protein